MSELLQEMMNIQNLLRKLEECGVEPKKADTSKPSFPDVLLCHVGWMITELSTMVTKAYENAIYTLDKEAAQKEINKVHRWLGYIQGILSAQRIYTIDDLRDQICLVFNLKNDEVSSCSSQN